MNFTDPNLRLGLAAFAASAIFLCGAAASASATPVSAPASANVGFAKCNATTRLRASTVNTLAPGTFQSKLIVEDLRNLASFYSEVLQIYQTRRFTSTMNLRPMEEVMFETAVGESHPLVLIKFLDQKASSHGQVVQVFFTDDLDSFLDRVQQCGGRLAERRDDLEHKARMAFWDDPEGNHAETVQLDYVPPAK